MSIFKSIFNHTKKEIQDFWMNIQTIEDVEEILNNSESCLVVIFKHSTRCIISKTVLKNFEQAIQENAGDDVEFYYLDLLQHRDVSNYIAEKLEVSHQSPQLILIKNRKVLHHSSHDRIEYTDVKKYVY